jgi:hypothetical protein
MHILLFIFYGLLAGYGVLRIPFIRKSGIRPAWLLLFFAAHVLLGCLHDVIAWRFYPGHGDLWDFFERSFLARREMTADLHAFLKYNANWNYFTHNNIIWVHVVLNYLSFDNIYINTLLFSFPVFLGNIALFRVFRRRFPDDPLTALSVLVFPSTLYWTSPVHREGAIYGLLGFLFYYMDRLLTRTSLRPVFYCLILFILVIYFRPAVALTLLPALLVWALFEKLPSRPKALLITGATAVALLALVFLAPALFDPLLRSLSDRQKEFQALEGGSRLYLPLLEPSGDSFLRALPGGARNGLFEPLPGSGGKAIYEAFSLELLLVWGIIVLAILRKLFMRQPSPSDRKRPTRMAGTSKISRVLTRLLPPKPASASSILPSSASSSLRSFPFSVACLIYALPGLVLVGMIVPFAGAIVRYRSIFLPFLLAPFLYSLRGTRLIKNLNKSLSSYIMEQ